MDFGSEKNKWGQSLWWGLHLVPPEYLRWDDWKIRVYQVYDNQIKFMKEARKWQDWYAVFRKVIKVKHGEKTGYFKYVPFDLLPNKEKESFNIWEMRHGILKINPEPGKKCIYRNDFLNWIKEKMIIRYHEMMAEPPERDYKKDQAVMDARGELIRVFQDIFKEDKTLRVLGVILPEPFGVRDLYRHLSFNPDEQTALELIYDFLPDRPGSGLELHKKLVEKLRKKISLIPSLGFKDRELLDPALVILRTGPEPWGTQPLNSEEDLDVLFHDREKEKKGML